MSLNPSQMNPDIPGGSFPPGFSSPDYIPPLPPRPGSSGTVNEIIAANPAIHFGLPLLTGQVICLPYLPYSL
jgi:hypothetical protein